MTGVEYVLQTSTTLQSWSYWEFFTGDGLPYEYEMTVSVPKSFYRIMILPFNNFGGEGEE